MKFSEIANRLTSISTPFGGAPEMMIGCSASSASKPLRGSADHQGRSSISE
jgi:hypothetical protein